jgi:hypothetical protein
MFFLLRVAFWLSIVLILLPSGDYQPKNSAPTIGAADAVIAASAAVSDMSGFCARQPEACEVGGQAAVALGQRAQAGARYLFDILQERVLQDSVAAPTQTGSIGAAGHPASQDTLTAADRSPQWQAPQVRPAPLPPRDPRRPA